LLEYLSGILSKRYNFPKLQFTQDCIELFMSYSWPGNVRELQNAIERAAVLSNDGIIKPQHLLPQIIKPPFSNKNLKSSTLKTLADIESEYINEVLRSVHGNRTQAAKILGIGTATLWRKLKT
jgi:transcriptional regulator with PAS, ATPase and Fis domain